MGESILKSEIRCSFPTLLLSAIRITAGLRLFHARRFQSTFLVYLLLLDQIVTDKVFALLFVICSVIVVSHHASPCINMSLRM